MAKEVYDYQSGTKLQGRPSRNLVAESLAETTGTGAVYAYRDKRGVWQYSEDRSGPYHTVCRTLQVEISSVSM